MRLTVFGSGHPYRGGIARTTTDLVHALEARGHDVLFLTPRRQYPTWLFPGASDRDPDACRRLDCAEVVLDPLQPLSWPGSKRRVDPALLDLGLVRSVALAAARPEAIGGGNSPQSSGSRGGSPAKVGGALGTAAM